MNTGRLMNGGDTSSLSPNVCYNSLFGDIARLMTGWILRNCIAHVDETPSDHGLSIGARKW